MEWYEEATRQFLSELKRRLIKEGLTSNKAAKKRTDELYDIVYESLAPIIEKFPLVIIEGILESEFYHSNEIELDTLEDVFEVIEKFEKVIVFYDANPKCISLAVAVYNFVFMSPCISIDSLFEEDEE